MSYNEQDLANRLITELQGDSSMDASPLLSMSGSKAQHRREETTAHGTINKQSPLNLVHRPKSALDLALPAYSNFTASGLPAYPGTQKSLVIRSHQPKFGNGRKATETAQPTSRTPEQEAIESITGGSIEPCTPRVNGLAAGIIHIIEREPNERDTHTFEARIDSDDALLNYFHSGRRGPTHAFVGKTIANGDWCGARVTVQGHEEPLRLHGKVTWADLLETLYATHPTCTCIDYPPEEDQHPDLWYDVWKVHVSLFVGEKVTQP